jgi:hypothetical protein
MFCNQCGSEIPPGYSVCPLCNPDVARPKPAHDPYGAPAPPAPGPYPGPALAAPNAPGPGPYAQMPPPGAPGPYGAQPYAPSAYAPTTNGMAIASLICGFAGCFLGIPWILAIVFGFVAISQINNSNGTQQGKGLAIAGIVIGVVPILIIFLYLVMMIVLVATGNIPSPVP